MFVVFPRQDDSRKICKEGDRQMVGLQDDPDEGLKDVQVVFQGDAQRFSQEVFPLVFQEQELRQQKSLQGFLLELAWEQEELQDEK
jgi:hypothetical protein